jgi:hypothetical protein
MNTSVLDSPNHPAVIGLTQPDQKEGTGQAADRQSSHHRRMGADAENPALPDQPPVLPLRLRGGCSRPEKALPSGRSVLISEYKKPERWRSSVHCLVCFVASRNSHFNLFRYRGLLQIL